MKLYRVTLLLLALAASLPAFGDEVTGLFSSFHVGVSGDITGLEVHIVPDPKGYSAVLQGSEGAPGFPDVVHINVTKAGIEFIVSEKSRSGLPPGEYQAVVTKEGLSLDGPGMFGKRFLPRKASFWQ